MAGAILKSQRGKDSVIFEGYHYKFYRRDAQGLFVWRCKTPGCVGKLSTTSLIGDQPVLKTNHFPYHPVNFEQCAVKLAVSKMKQHAQRTTLPMPVIYREVSTELAVTNPVASALLPPFFSVDSSMYRQRHKGCPPLPQARADINIGPAYSQLQDGQRFLLATLNNNDILMFATDANLDKLFRSPHIFMDGTFDAAPRLYSQLYTIHAIEGESTGKIIPLVFCLMNDKTRQSYQQIFRLLKDNANDRHIIWQPRNITTDFESSALKALANEFPAAELHGCFFHFCQAIYRKIQSLGLAQQYHTNNDVRTACRRLMALAFLPVHLVEQWFALLPPMPAINDLLAYFENYWLTEMNPAIWNMHNVARRTNNDVEGWHNRFNRIIQRHHPNLWQFINAIRDEQLSTQVICQQIVAGQTVYRRNKKYAAIDARITTLKRRYLNQQIDALQFIEGCAHNLADPLGF